MIMEVIITIINCIELIKTLAITVHIGVYKIFFAHNMYISNISICGCEGKIISY